jgi:ribosome-associated protein
MTDTTSLLAAVYDGIFEKRGSNVVSMDFTKHRNALADYFVICEAQSDRQVAAIADFVLENAFKKTGQKAVYAEGFENAQWILLDFTDVVVHIFQTEFREFYNLEGLWADAEISQIQEPKPQVILNK